MEKRILLLLLLFCGFKVHCKAQTTKITTTSHGFNAFDNKVVKDSTGAVIPLEQWHKIFTTGQYRLQGLPNNADTMLLIKMSDAELEAMDTRMPPATGQPGFPAGHIIQHVQRPGYRWQKDRPKGTGR